jgi:hypothetical protein
MVACEVWPKKEDPDRTQFTTGGNCICYPGDVGTNTALLELVKLLLNSVLSWKGPSLAPLTLKTSTLILLCPILNMFASRLPTYLRSSLKSTSLQVASMMDGYISKSARVVMASHRKVS